MKVKKMENNNKTTTLLLPYILIGGILFSDSILSVMIWSILAILSYFLIINSIIKQKRGISRYLLTLIIILLVIFFHLSILQLLNITPKIFQQSQKIPQEDVISMIDFNNKLNDITSRMIVSAEKQNYTLSKNLKNDYDQLRFQIYNLTKFNCLKTKQKTVKALYVCQNLEYSWKCQQTESKLIGLSTELNRPDLSKNECISLTKQIFSYTEEIKACNTVINSSLYLTEMENIDKKCDI
ncbi:MAG: hypothetical protein V1875_03795 [Candidatus Altiarchaeota archaeon]